MPHYAQLYEQVGESKDIGQLLEEDPLAASLFLISLARADLYGILPGDARDYRTRVCPSAAVPVPQVETAIASMVRLGMYHAYEANGKQYLYVIQYHSYQQVRWDRTGRPGSPLPECWIVPKGLQDELAKASNKTPAYFGLTDAMTPLPEQSWNGSGLTEKGYKRNGTGPGVVQEQARSGPGLLPTVAVTASASVTNESKEERLLSEPDEKGGSDPTADLREAKQQKAHRDADRLRDQMARLDVARAALTDVDRALLDRLTTAQEQEKGRPRTALQQATDAEDYVKSLQQYGTYWREGVDAAIAKSAGIAYARAVAKNRMTEAGNGNGSRTGQFAGGSRVVAPLPAPKVHGIQEVF